MAKNLDEALSQAPTEWSVSGKSGSVLESAAAQEALDARVDYSIWGVPRTINAIAHPLPFLGAAPENGAGAIVAQRFFNEFGSDFPVLDWAHIEFVQLFQDIGPLGWRVYRVSQVLDGVPVRNSDMVLHVDQNGALRYFHGNFYSDLFAEPLDFVMEYTEAAAKANANLVSGEEFRGMELQYVDTTISGSGPKALKPMYVVYAGSRVFQLDGVTGLLAGEQQLDAFALQMVHRNVGHKKQLYTPTSWSYPVYARLLQIYNKFGTWGWQSYDGNDSPMRVYADYCFCNGTEDDCENAAGTCDCTIIGDLTPRCMGIPTSEKEPQLGFWYGGTDAANFNRQIGALAPECGDSTCTAGESCSNCSADCGVCPPSCGNGTCDTGETCLICPGDCGVCAGPGAVVGLNNDRLDVLAHEFAHGFNQSTSSLIYEKESGALAEGFADCFAAMVDTANWTLFESSGFVNAYDSTVVRSLSDPHQTNLVPPYYVEDSAPCTALYPHYGHCADHFLERSTRPKGLDFGGVHEDSGILAKACWLLGSSASNTFYGVTVQGQGRTATGYVFHYAQRQFLTSSSKFSDARAALLTAGFLYDAAQGDPSLTMTVQTTNAMDAVGIWSKSGNVGGNQKNRTRNPVAAVEQAEGTSYRRLIFFRQEDAANPRLKYLQYVPGSGWSKSELPVQTPMLDIPPTAVETITSGAQKESSVFYQTTGNSLTRAYLRNGVVGQTGSSEQLLVQSAAQVGGVSAGSINYGVGYKLKTGEVHVAYFTHIGNTLDGPLEQYDDITVMVGTSYPGTAVMPWGGVSMTRGNGRVWLAYQNRKLVQGTYHAGDLCVTHIPESAFAWDYALPRLWAQPTCFNSNQYWCNGAYWAPVSDPLLDATRAPIIFAYAPNAASPTRYYLAYVNKNFDVEGRPYFPAMFTFTWNAGTHSVSPMTRAVMLANQTAPAFSNSNIPPEYFYGTPAVGGFLKDTQGNLRFYYVDAGTIIDDLGDYISELVKHGY